MVPAEIDVPRSRRAAPADLVIADAEVVVTMDDNRTELAGGWVAVRDGVVESVGVGTAPEGIRRLSARGCIVTPGFINTHHHIYQNLTRTSFPALAARDFFLWLSALYPVWRGIDADATYAAAFVGAAELALGGATTTTDMHYIHPAPGLIDAAIAGVGEVGLRFHPTRGAMDFPRSAGGLPPDDVCEDRSVALEDAERLISTYHDASAGAMVRIGLGPCSPFAATGDLYREMHALAERHDLRLHSHWAESPEELSFVEERFGMHTLDYFRSLGINTSRTWLAHVLYPRPQDITAFAEWGVGVAHCPGPTFMMGGRSGAIAPIREIRDAGVVVGLGCDGSASNDAASMWLDAHRMVGLQRLRHHQRLAGMSGREAIEIATRGSAALLGRSGELGELTPGAAGDLVAWPIDGPSYSGAVADVVEALLQSGPNAARHTVVAGRVVVEDAQVTAPGLDDAIREHRRHAQRLQGTDA